MAWIDFVSLHAHQPDMRYQFRQFTSLRIVVSIFSFNNYIPNYMYLLPLKWNGFAWFLQFYRGL